MTELARIDYPVVLPSGEQADFSHWVTVASDADAVIMANAYQTSLSGSAPWKGLFSTTTLFGLPKVSIVDQATGQILRTLAGTGTYAGTAITNPLPPQLSPCVSLRTARSGASYRGRYYIPAPVVGVLDATGRILAAQVLIMVNALSAAHAAEITADPTGFVVIYSRTHRTVEPVLTLDIGNVMDTQRRRRDKLVEVRQSNLI